MNKIVQDIDDGDYMFKISNNIAIDSDGDMMMKISNNTAMDMDSGELHFTSSWNNDDDDDK